MKGLLDLLSKYQIALILAMLALGFIIPDVFSIFNPYNTVFLQIIMFVAGLEMNYTELFAELADWKTLLLTNAAKLVIIPVLVSIPLAVFAPEWSLPFIVAASMPTGLTAHALVAILGGRTSLALVSAATTSLLAPFTIPFVLKFLIGHEVFINTSGMMIQIASAVVLPLLLAGIIQRLVGRTNILKADVPLRTASSPRSRSSSLGSRPPRRRIAQWRRTHSDIGLRRIIILSHASSSDRTAWLASASSWRKLVDRATITFCLIYRMANARHLSATCLPRGRTENSSRSSASSSRYLPPPLPAAEEARGPGLPPRPARLTMKQ